jgi:PAS domain S-box-containing protein
MNDRRTRLRVIADLVRSASGVSAIELLARAAATVPLLDPRWCSAVRSVDRAQGGYRLIAASGALNGALPTLIPFGQGLTGAVAAAGQPLLVPDVFDDPRAVREGSAAVSGCPGYYGVPIGSGTELVGVLNVRFPSASPPGVEERELIELLAGLTAVAVRGSRLYRESETRRQEAEIIAEVGALVAQSLDLAVVGQRIATFMLRLLGARASVLYSRGPESEDLTVLATVGDAARTLAEELSSPPNRRMLQRVLSERHAVTIQDLLAEPRLLLSGEAWRRLAAGAHHVLLAIPLIAQDRVIGALCLTDQRGRHFEANQIQLAQTFAGQAAMALENARLFAETRERLRETTTLLSVGQILSRPGPGEEVMHHVAREVARAFDADMVGAYFLNEANDALVPLAGYGVPKDLRGFFQSRPIVLSRFPWLLPAWRDGRAVWSSDALHDPGFDREWVGILPPHSVLFGAASAHGEPVGGLFLVWWQAGRTFSPADLRLIEGVARQVGLALENTDLRARQTAARAAIQATQEQYRMLVEGSIQGIFIHTHPVLTFCNAAAASMFGYDGPADLVGKDYRILVAPHERARLEEYRTARLRGEPAPVHYEWEGVRRDGTPLWAETLVSIVTWNGEQAILVTLFDITERKLAEDALRQNEAQLRQAQKMEAIGRLAGGIAHDFNNLLTVISGRSQLLLKRLGADAAAARDVDLIHATADRAATLTRQLLAFSRRQVLQPTLLDLDAVISDMTTMLRRLIGEDVDLVTPASPDVARVKADRGQLEQVIMNLAINARDAMPTGGRLTIEQTTVELDAAFVARHPGSRPGSFVFLAVSDTGIGMDQDTLAHAFEPFFTTKPPGKGTGLGLSTVYGIVKQHDGYITIESEPGRGTTVRMYLPRAADEPVEAESTGTREGRGAGGSETILLVEDDGEVRRLARDVLRTHGYTVLEAADSGDALRIADRHSGPIHLLLTDVVMPQVSGLELAERMAALRPSMRVLFMSAHTHNAIAHRGVLDAGRAFIEKPFSPLDALAHKVREVLDSPRPPDPTP